MRAFQGSLPGGRGRNGMPELPYQQRSHAADRRREAEVGAQLAAIRAQIERGRAAPPAMDPPVRVIALPAVPAAVPPVPVRPGPAVTGPPEPAPARCDDCGYLTSAIGHKITCGAS